MNADQSKSGTAEGAVDAKKKKSFTAKDAEASPRVAYRKPIRSCFRLHLSSLE